MLNGVAPILIIDIGPNTPNPLFNSLTGIPILGSVLPTTGIPIPLYLDEQLTGLYVDSETKAVDLEVDANAKIGGENPDVKQNTIDNTVTVNLFAKRDSLLLSVLNALNDQIFTQAARGNYKVSYLNGATVLFGGKIKSMTSSEGVDDDLVRISLVISKANLRPPTEPPQGVSVPPIPGAQLVQAGVSP